MKHFLLLLLLYFCYSSTYAQLSFQSQINPDNLLLTRSNLGEVNSRAVLTHESLLFQDDLGTFDIDRMTLNKSGLTLINGGSWTSARLRNGTGSSGTLELYAGGGTGINIYAGPNTSDATRGRLIVYDGGANKVEFSTFDAAGIVAINGNNGTDNAFVSFPATRPNMGYLGVEDTNGQIQAGLIVNADGTGSVFGDTKNFRMPHPEQDGKEIWYASIEGPEAAAYERGTATLRYGEAFVPFSDHFQLVMNPESMTVILTPHSANTYGLAVIEKTPKGIRVKELKGGTGNFSFDWEVKAVRKGYEDYRVIRDASEMIPGHKEDIRSLQTNTGTENPDAAADEAENKEAQPLEKQLGQNRPNPFREHTSIPYAIPGTVQQAALQIFDAAGKLVQTHRLNPGAEGMLEISAGQLPPGMYTYSLIADGQLLTSRQMVIAR